METMEEFKAAKTVYGYLFPEVIKAIEELFRKFPFDLLQKSWKTPGLDEWHIPIISKYIDFYGTLVPWLKNFSFAYPTANGSEEGIREILIWLRLRGVKNIYILKGEYEGYREVSGTRGIQAIEVDPKTNPENLKRGYWFISNPSSRDGNIISNEFINRICDAGHQVFYDLAYLGLTESHQFDLSHPNIFAVATSLSKSFGLFYFRIGYTFTKEEIPSLHANKLWFKSVPNLLITEKIIDTIDSAYISNRYKPIQTEIVAEINERFGLKIKSSDALLLGYLTKKDAESLNKIQREIIKPFKRGNLYRFCLTPYYQDKEKTD